MNGDIKRALREYKAARRQTDNMALLNEDYDSCPRNVYLDDEDLEHALKKEKEAVTIYITLLLQKRGWTQTQIHERLKSIGLAQS